MIRLSLALITLLGPAGCATSAATGTPVPTGGTSLAAIADAETVPAPACRGIVNVISQEVTEDGPNMLVHCQPDYPISMLSYAIEARCEARFLVEADGRATDIVAPCELFGAPPRQARHG